MKRLAITFVTLLLLIPAFCISQDITAYLSYSVFNTPENKPYVETYLTIKGSSVKYKLNDNGMYQAVVGVQYIFTDNDSTANDSVVNYAKYKLNGPEVKDTTSKLVNMLDVQRYYLDEGEYNFNIRLRDLNSTDSAITTVDNFTISFPKDKICFSDIELLNSYKKSDSASILNKNGYKLDPNILNYYDNKTDVLSYYAEIYNTKEVLGENPFLIKVYIRPFETNIELSDYIIFKRMTPQNVIVLLSSFDIKDLATGNYILVAEVYDRNNKKLAGNEKYFQRYNPDVKIDVNKLMNINTKNTFVGNFNSKDTLLGYIDYLYPISSNMEKIYIKNQAAIADIDELKSYFYSFWLERDKANPQEAWEEYLRRVMEVNKDFKSMLIPGYKTDRGRVYLQYGRPNVISEQYHEPAAYPYEIWHYYQLNDQRDRKFVFYSHDLVTNDFLLIHSNAIGEVNNYRWQTIIYRRTWDPTGIDEDVIPSTWGSKATETYRQPW